MPALISLLKCCAAIERESAELYHWFSDLFHEDRRAAILWKKSAMEEENHESQFLLAEKLADSMLAIPLQEQGQAEAALERLRTLRRVFQADPPHLVRGLETALLLVEELSRFHLENVLLYSNEDHRRMFEAMMAHDRDHAESFKCFFKEMTAAAKSPR